MTNRRRPLARPLAIGVVAASLFGAVATPMAATAETPAAPTATTYEGVVITVGDSFISGEGGRWAGNSNQDDQTPVDALGPKAYFDNPGDTAELIPGCHRSKAAEAHIDPTVLSINLACSGARTYSFSESGLNKPGVDFGKDGIVGQAELLELAAVDAKAKAPGKAVLVALSIGGNDFGVSDVLTSCVRKYLGSQYCHNKAENYSRISPDQRALIGARIESAITNVRTAMTNAGYGADEWRLAMQNYAQPVPYPSDFRNWQNTPFARTGQGCPLYDADVSWLINDYLGAIEQTMRAAAVAQGVTTWIDLTHITSGRRLCEQGVAEIQDSGLSSWSDPGGSDRLEWINALYLLSYGGRGGYTSPEAVHPNYWAQLAQRNCLRQVWNGGAIRGGTCLPTGGVNDRNEPNVKLNSPVSDPTPVGTADRFEVSGAFESLPRAVLANDVDESPSVLPLTDLRPAGVSSPQAVPEGAIVVEDAPDQTSAALVSGPEHGELILLPDGSFTYTPEPGYTGTDTFVYTASDYRGTSQPTTVELVVVGTATPVTVSPAFTG